jgi:hypothetical protein
MTAQIRTHASLGRETTPSRRRLRAALATLVLAGTGLVIAATVDPAQAAAPSAFVRVNQVGYVASAPKRAYLLASGLQTGATFSLRNGSTTVFSGPIGADLGSWTNAYPHVYALDFDAVSTVGAAYTIVVIHHLCDRCDPYSMTLADFTAFVDWLATRSAGGTVVRTTAEVIGGPVQPPVTP